MTAVETYKVLLIAGRGDWGKTDFRTKPLENFFQNSN